LIIPQILTLAAIPQAVRIANRLKNPPSDWRQQQDSRIRQIIQYAYHHSAYYHQLWDEAGVGISRINGAGDLNQLPMVERLDWRAAPAGHIMPHDLRGPLRWRRTSGTMSDSLRMPYTIQDDITFRATIIAMALWNQARWTDRVLVLLSPRSTYTGKMRRFLGREVLVSSGAAPEEQVQALKQGGFRQLRTNPWVLWRAVVHARRTGVALPPVKLTFTGSEVLTTAARRTIEQTLSTRVIDHYGANDLGYMTEGCPHGNLHVLPSTVHLEIIKDGKPAEPAEEGELVVTNFISHARPIVRVRTGDRAAWSAETCPCGIPAPYLAYVAGRLEDQIVCSNGNRVTWPAIEEALASQGDVVFGYQAEQITADHVILRLSLESQEQSLAAVKANLAALLPGVNVEIELTDHFKQEPNGKIRPVIGLSTDTE